MSVIRVATAGSALATQRTAAPPPREAGKPSRSIGPAAIVAVRAQLLSATDSAQDRVSVRERTETDALGISALQRVRELFRPGLNTIKTDPGVQRATVQTAESASAPQATAAKDIQTGFTVAGTPAVEPTPTQLQPFDPAMSARQLAADLAETLARRPTDVRQMQAAQLHSRAAMQILG